MGHLCQTAQIRRRAIQRVQALDKQLTKLWRKTIMILIAILFGIVLGQHIKIAVSPDLSAFFKASWASLGDSMPALSEWCDRAFIAKLQSVPLGASRTIEPGEEITDEELSTLFPNKVDNPRKTKAPRRSEDYL
jgi:hypothetical protein